MNVEFKESFKRDLKKIVSSDIRSRVKSAIEEVEKAERISDIPHIKKLKGAGSYYRMRIGDYRIGIKLGRNKAIFVRCLHRKDIYRYFP